MPEPITQEEFLFEAQQALDELSAEELLAFPLIARKIDAGNNDLYTIYFHDNRFHSLVIRWRRGQSFRLEFRDAMLRQAHSRGWSNKKTKAPPSKEQQWLEEGEVEYELFPSFHKYQYEQWQAIWEDREKLPPLYRSWLRTVFDHIFERQEDGVIVIPIDVDLPDFLRWCVETNESIDTESLRKFVRWKWEKGRRSK